MCHRFDMSCRLSGEADLDAGWEEKAIVLVERRYSVAKTNLQSDIREMLRRRYIDA